MGSMRYPLNFRLWLLLAFLTATAVHAEEITHSGEQKDFVAETLPWPVDAVHERILALFDSDARDYYEGYPAAIYDLPDHAANIDSLTPEAYEKFTRFPLIRPSKFYVFYGAYPSMQHVARDMDVLAAMGHSNVALQRYARLPADARLNDVYLWSPDAPFWHSDYMRAGKPLPFHSYFIIHLTSADSDTHTTVEIIEDQPQVKLGSKTSVDVHGILHRFDIREVEPTTGDREFLLSCIRQFIERKLPGRHWFSCKTPAELDEPAPVPFTVP